MWHMCSFSSLMLLLLQSSLMKKSLFPPRPPKNPSSLLFLSSQVLLVGFFNATFSLFLCETDVFNMFAVRGRGIQYLRSLDGHGILQPCIAINNLLLQRTFLQSSVCPLWLRVSVFLLRYFKCLSPVYLPVSPSAFIHSHGCTHRLIFLLPLSGPALLLQ